MRQILAHAGEPTTAPALAPARSPPVEVHAQQLMAPDAGDHQGTSPVGADAEPVPELEFDQTLGW